MKKIFLLLATVALFSACSWTQTNEDTSPDTPTDVSDSNELPTDPNKRYVSTSTEECSRVFYQCEAGTESFSDDTGCGCNVVDRDIVDALSSEEPECGLIDGETVNCGEGEICASVAWISQVAKCYPNTICEQSECGQDAQCVTFESFPAQVMCAPNPKSAS